MAILKKLSYVDATCPLVSKVHREAENLYKNNFDIILIGHKNHPEVVGTMGQLPKGAVKLIETMGDVASLKAINLKIIRLPILLKLHYQLMIQLK